MARIPDITALGQRNVPVSGRSIPSYQPQTGGEEAQARAMAATGRALESVGESIDRVDTEQRRKEGLLSVARANSAVLAESLKAHDELITDTDYSTWADRYKARVEKARDGVLGDIADPYLREEFSARADDVINRGMADLRGKAKTREADDGQAYLFTFLDGQRDLFTKAPDEPTRQLIMETAHDAIDGARAKTYISAEAAAKLRKKTAEDFLTGWLKSLPESEQIRLLEGDAGAAGVPGGPQAPAPSPGLAGVLGTAIKEAAQRHGIDADTLARIAQVESRGRSDAVNPASGAKGAFQFVDSTARQYGLADPRDPESSADAAARLLVDNGRAMTGALGREPKPSDLYLAHQQGARGAAALLRNPGSNAVDVLTRVYDGNEARARAAITQNGGTIDMTAEEFTAKQAARFGEVKVASADAAAAITSDALPSTERGLSGLISQLPEDKAAAILYTARQRQYTKDVRERQAAVRANQAFEADLEVAVSRGQASYDALDTARRTGRIDDTTWKRLTLKVDEQTEKQRAIDEAIAKVSRAGSGGPPLDPKNTDDKKALDLHYDSVSQAWATLPPDQVRERALDYASRYGMVPEQVRGMVRGGLHSGNAGQAIMAADTVDRLRNANPQLVGEIADENDLRLANLISTYVASGIPAEQAYGRAVESFKVDKGTRDTRKADFELQRGKTEADRLASDRKWIEGKVNSIWTADPTVDPVMAREFEDLARTEFERSGNLEAARSWAFQAVNRQWGRTKVGGDNRYMKYAPEKFYGVPTLSPGDNAAWMNEQLLADVGNGALQDPKNPLTADRLSLMPDPTRVGPDGRPVYRVSVLGKDGVFYAVSDSRGLPMAWTPDWNSSPEAARRAKAQADAVADARAKRAGMFATPQGRPELAIP